MTGGWGAPMSFPGEMPAAGSTSPMFDYNSQYQMMMQAQMMSMQQAQYSYQNSIISQQQAYRAYMRYQQNMMSMYSMGTGTGLVAF